MYVHRAGGLKNCHRDSLVGSIECRLQIFFFEEVNSASANKIRGATSEPMPFLPARIFSVSAIPSSMFRTIELAT